MKRLTELTLFIMGMFLLTGCVAQPTLPPNHLIDGKYMNIHSPNSEGWIKMDHSNQQVVFGKKGTNTDESYIARVTFFPLPDTKTKEEFLNLIRDNTPENMNKERYIEIKSSFSLYKQRSYECVMAEGIYKDKMAKTSSTSEELLMQNKSLYCKDPKRDNTGFTVGYSFRGESLDPDFDSEADSFIDGVRFPKYN